MPLAKGDAAPSVVVRGAAADVALPCPSVPNVLFFYPTNQGRTCVTEIADFDARLNEFASIGVKVFGVTTEDISEVVALKEAKSFSVPLCFDPSGKASELYGVRNAYGYSDRYTFAISSKGVVLFVWQAYDTVGHAQAVLEFCRNAALG